MKLTVSGAALSRGLKQVRGAIERRSTIPILQHVLLKAEAGELVIRGTDLDLEVRVHVPAQTADTGVITTPHSILEAFVSKLPSSGDISLETDAEWLKIASGRTRAKLPTLPESDFPDLSLGDVQNTFVVEGKDIGELLGRASFAMSTEETRYYLNGVYFHLGDGKKLLAVATDGHRLAKIELPMPAGADKMPGIIIPRKTIVEAMKLAGSGPVKIQISTHKIQFGFDEGCVLISKLIDGTFPDYTRVIPTTNERIATLDRKMMQSAVERVSTVKSKDGRAVKLAFSDKGLALSMNTPDTGSASEECDAEFAGEALDIGFNSGYVVDILSEIAADKITMAMGDPGSPAVVRGEGETDATYVLMPMRI